MANYQALLDDSINASRTQAGAAVGSAQSGVQAILAGGGALRQAVGDMRGAANKMIPIADTMRGEGDAMYESGTKVTDQALESLGTGLGFIRMDANESPLVAEALKNYDNVDPDKYVASAKQDVQSQFDNSRAQSERQLSRMGVSPTSGAFANTASAYDRLRAVAAAAAMTRARQQGLTDRISAFQSLIANNANTFLQTGGQLASIGSTMQAHGVEAQKGAAGVLGSAGSLYGDAGNLGLAYDRALSGAYNSLAGVQLNQAKNTMDSEAVRVSAVNGGSATGGAPVGGVNITSSGDDWMNWKGTGHSEGWNKNNNPDYSILLNNGQ